MDTHEIAVGDTLTPLGARLRQLGTSGVYEDVNLTDKTVTFKMVAEDGTVVVPETSTGVTVVTASEGKVKYDFAAEDVDEAGVFYAWFRVADTGGETDTFPRGGRQFKIIIHELS